MRERVISVSQLVRYLKSKLDNDPLIQKIQIEGEISNLTLHRSGHWYFSLKDANSRISCVMFQSYARLVKMTPKNGDKVIVSCSTSMFESAGSIQLYCTSMKPSGIGDLYVQLEMLKEKLRNEGLFSVEHKKKLPSYPMKIGVIVGANTAAREDIMTTLSRRWPVAEIVEFHSLVQGETAHLHLIGAVLKADQADCDVLILARGGGSIEDLWAFNNEDLARTIFHLKTPIVTGIGHEVDFTICDFVADVRAATPTAAAETVSPLLYEVMQRLSVNEHRMIQAVNKRLESESQLLKSLSDRKVFKDPDALYASLQMKLDFLYTQLLNSMNNVHTKIKNVRTSVWKCSHVMNQRLQHQMLKINEKTQRMNTAVELNVHKQNLVLKYKISQLDAYSPLKVLLRGYSITSYHHHPITSIHEVKKTDVVDVRLSDGELKCQVLDKGEIS